MPLCTEQLETLTAGKAQGAERGRKVPGEASSRRIPRSGRQDCCDCCSNEQGDKYAEDQERQKESSDTVAGERLQLRRGRSMITLEESEGKIRQAQDNGGHM